MKSKIVYALIAIIIAPFCAEAVDSMTSSNVNIVFIGDSITMGVGVRDKSTQAAPVMCVSELKKQLPNASICFSNQGCNGFTTKEFLPGAKPLADVVAAAKQLNGEHPGYLVFSIMLGTNDSSNTYHITDTNYCDNLKRIIDHLLADFPDSKITLNRSIWYSPNTHNTADYEGDSAADRLKSYFPKIDALVAEYQVSNPHHVFGGDVLAYNHFSINFQSQLTPENGTNGIFFLHPNALGAEKLGEFWANALIQNVMKEN